MERWVPALVIAVALSACTGGNASEATTGTPTTATTHAAAAPAASAPDGMPSTASTTVVTSPVPFSTRTSPITTQLVGDPYTERRNSMVDRQIVDRLIHDPEVIAAMRAVQRHQFVPEDFVDQAYDDHPLPIGYGQTISQPFIVAMMSEALVLSPGARVLEIGTGSGYQAAVLAEMGAEVYTIEIIEELAAAADARLRLHGYDVTVLNADGYFGWEEHAPFDAIIVTAAPDHLPQPLVGQLAIGGNLVIPIGPIGAVQTLWRFRLGNDGGLTAENLGGVLFVPFTRSED